MAHTQATEELTKVARHAKRGSQAFSDCCRSPPTRWRMTAGHPIERCYPRSSRRFLGVSGRAKGSYVQLHGQHAASFDALGDPVQAGGRSS